MRGYQTTSISPTPLALQRRAWLTVFLWVGNCGVTTHGAAWWAQSELFFRLLLKNTVCSPHKAAYAYFWRVLTLARGRPTIQNLIFGGWARGRPTIQNPTFLYVFNLNINKFVSSLVYRSWSCTLFCFWLLAAASGMFLSLTVVLQWLFGLSSVMCFCHLRMGVVTQLTCNARRVRFGFELAEVRR